MVESQGALNIGSVARAMLNFGLTDLRLVNPQADHHSDEARRMAVKAVSVLERAPVFPDLAAALADCHFALGTTRRFGKYREDFLNPDGAADRLLAAAGSGRSALVLGREDRGLLTAELDLCQGLITIPTSDSLPSMNLAQAAAVCLYEIARAAGKAAGKSTAGRKAANGELLEAMFRHMRRSLLAIGFLDPQNPEHILRSFRRLFGRAGLDEREIRILHGLWRRLDWVEGERSRLEAGGKRQEEEPEP